jgi:hypothetical protein
MCLARERNLNGQRARERDRRQMGSPRCARRRDVSRHQPSRLASYGACERRCLLLGAAHGLRLPAGSVTVALMCSFFAEQYIGWLIAPVANTLRPCPDQPKPRFVHGRSGQRGRRRPRKVSWRFASTSSHPRGTTQPRHPRTADLGRAASAGSTGAMAFARNQVSLAKIPNVDFDQ